MMRRMEPRDLLQLLMDRDGLNSSSLAARLNNATTQPQIHKFLSGKAKEPRRSTLAPIATHFRIPLDALYDPVIAGLTAKQKQLIGEDMGDSKPVPVEVPVSEAAPKQVQYSTNAAMLAAMVDCLPNDEAVRTYRIRRAVDALLGIERPTNNRQKSDVPAAASTKKQRA